MDDKTLRRVQLMQLDIAKEIKRICQEQNIKFFLAGGTLLGAVRHKGFIPWDDDLDIGMLQSDYEIFCQVAPKYLSNKYKFINWHIDERYGLSFGKVYKVGTVFQESKSYANNTNGIYVDIIVYHNAPTNPASQQKLINQLNFLERLILMKNHYRPWMDNNKINWKKRFMYVPIQLLAKCFTRSYLIKKHMELTNAQPISEFLYEQLGPYKVPMFKRRWFEKVHCVAFEDTQFPIIEESDSYLRSLYGDYMLLPPENERENRHQIVKLEFGEDN